MVNIGVISLAISFKILAGSRSGPVALLALSLSSSLKTPSLVTDISDMAGIGLPTGVGMLLLSPLVHVNSYCLLRISALSLGSAWSLPFSFRGAIPLVSFRIDLMNDQKRFCLG